MIKTITVGNTTLTINDIYRFCYNGGEGREVLRLRIERATHGFEEIAAVLENQTEDIVYKEDGVVVGVHKGYSKTFECDCKKEGIFEVELGRVSRLELEVEALKTEVAQLKAAQGAGV